MKPPWEILKLLSDSTRLRILALIWREELSVAELQSVLDMAQSRISSHLALLRQAGLVMDRREGKKTFYSPARVLEAPVRTLLEAALEAGTSQPEFIQDGENLERVLELRRQHAERYFNLIAGRLGKQYCPGRSWEAIGHLLLRLVPAIDVADLGAGEGMVAQLLARRARQVVCIDNSPRMVEVGTELARKNGLTNLTYKLGDIEQVPLPDASVDLAYLSQALHHARRPATAVAEAFRILRPGGSLVVLDLKEHTFEAAREQFADLWLGFSEAALHRMLKQAGFASVEAAVVSREAEEPRFETVLAAGFKPVPAGEGEPAGAT
ncbi:MAG: methyltransferase domain-containing protein [Puniceicoccaceae bacterium]|nr:MAG: methyltransferase domain-containing protein [Puniceicoccaceae bacterium]